MLAPSTAKFAGYRVEGIAGRGGMGVVYKATQLGSRPSRRVEGRRGRAARRSTHSRALPARVACRGGDRAPQRHPDPRLRRVPRTGVHRHALRRRRRPARAGHRHRAARAGARGGDRGPCRPTRSTPRTMPGSSTATSSPRTSCSAPHDQVYLSDFGLASHALSEGGLTSPGGWVGTMDFMAPEQIRGEPVDRRADIYALGCVLHFALTGQAAYPRETDEARLWAHLHAAPPEPSQLVPGVPAAFDEVVRRALEKRPEARPASAGELGAAALAAAGRPAAARAKRTAAPRRRRRSATAVTWPDGPRRGRRRPVLGAAAATAVLAGAVAAFLLTHEPRRRRTRDRRAAGDHDDRGRGGQAARRQGARHPRPARRPRRSTSARGRSTSRSPPAAPGSPARARRRSTASRSAVTFAAAARASASASRTSPTGAESCG